MIWVSEQDAFSPKPYRMAPSKTSLVCRYEGDREYFQRRDKFIVRAVNDILFDLPQLSRIEIPMTCFLD